MLFTPIGAGRVEFVGDSGDPISPNLQHSSNSPQRGILDEDMFETLNHLW